jgi:hypothetical protein
MYNVYYINTENLYPSEDNNYVWFVGNSIIKSIISLTRTANLLIFKKCLLFHKIPQDSQQGKIWRKNGRSVLLKCVLTFT